MAKYKVCDKVRVRTDLEKEVKYWMDGKSDYWYFDCTMENKLGKVVTISYVDKNYYQIKEDCGFDYWSDEMFEGLAEEKPEKPDKPATKYKIGDRVLVRNDLEVGERYPDMAFLIDMAKFKGKVVTINQIKQHWYGIEGYDQPFWTNDMFVGLAEETPAAPITVNLNININIDNYANSCWHCRKGGIVDLYLNGKPGVCPTCGRVCNVVQKKTEPLFAEIVSWDLPSPMPKENKPLTNDEIKALPNGSKVFVVRTENGVEVLTDTFTCWRTVEHYGKSIKLKRKKGFCWDRECNNDGLSYHVYLEMPEGAVDSRA